MNNPSLLDLGPAAQETARIVSAIDNEQLANPTPCPEMSVATLLDHFMGLTKAFTGCALKSQEQGNDKPPVSSADNLDPAWRTELPLRLQRLANAWRDPQAWQGMSEAGGVTMPSEIMGVVALDEIVLHGWDLAVATGQSYEVDEVSTRAIYEFTSAAAAEGTPAEGVFGPPVAVPEDAPTFNRALGFAGRNPDWKP